MFDVTDRVVTLLGIPRQFTGEAALSATVTVTAGSTWQAQATATAVGDLAVAAAGDRTTPGSAALTGTLTALSDATRITGGAAALEASAASTGAATRVCVGVAGMSAESVLVAAGGFISQADIDLVADAAVAADGTRVRDGAASMNVRLNSDFTATGSPVIRLFTATVERAITDDWLFQRYPIHCGLSLLVTGSSVVEVESPSQTELKEADYYFMGGRHHQLTESQRDVLVAAGFGSYIEEV